jgi:hypothetical protein
MYSDNYIPILPQIRNSVEQIDAGHGRMEWSKWPAFWTVVESYKLHYTVGHITEVCYARYPFMPGQLVFTQFHE